METTNLYDREQFLRSRLNTFLHTRLQLPEKDYYGELDQDSLAELKSVLSDINNIFTLKVCLSFASWLATSLDLDDLTTEQIERSILGKKPNSNGYDLEISEPVSVIAEVKCNIPINQGSIYGRAQQIGIAKDLHSLLNGKSRSKIKLENYLKFFVLLDTPNIRKATEHLLRNRPEFEEKIAFVSPGISLTSRDVIYLVYVTPAS